MKLNLGCGRDIREGWLNVDREWHEGTDATWDMTDPMIPGILWAEPIHEVLLSHVIEHLADPLAAMENLWKLVQPGCRLTVLCPHGGSDDAWADPTHVRAMFPTSFAYFGQPAYHQADYGYRGDWKVVESVLWVADETARSLPNQEAAVHAIRHQRNVVQEIEVVLVAVKPARDVDEFEEPVVTEVRVR